MSDQSRFAELWTDYLEGELEEPGIAELRELLAADESLLKLAADMYQTHHLLGLVVDEEPTRQDKFVRATLAQLPNDSGKFIDGVMAGVTQVANTRDSNQRLNESQPHFRSAASPDRKRNLYRGVMTTAAIMLLAIFAYSFRPTSSSEIVEDNVNPSGDSLPTSDARFANLAHAKFFGELQPPVNSVLTPRRDYVLMSGLVEIQFPAGASAILEGPAVFRVLSNESLALDVGRCSVHAPDGAEGFRVETPVTRVIDRGTRFSVSVSETSETEVQVIEGAADLFQQSNYSAPQASSTNGRSPTFEVRLGSSQAQTFTNVGKFSADEIPFNSNVYQRRLPDRVISYQATQDASGRAEMLTSVTVQRGGHIVEIPVDDLIPVEVTSYTGQSGHAFIASNGTLPSRRSQTSSDRSLLTGVINPGGSQEPLTSDPVISVPEDSGASVTPGMAIRFKSSVVNGPGADVIFFDLQTFGNPPDGDAFHVCPLKFREGLKTHTIRVYDLTMESPAALDLQGFHIHMFKDPVESIAMLETAECASRFAGMKFRGLVVGIDLSDLGYQNGESVDGLFIQDAMDDKHHVDPVFIAGLPSSNEVQDTQP